MTEDRYIRQTSLIDFGPEAQKKLLTAKVLVIGAGGLGIPVLQYLNAMGIGVLGVVDQDIISISNLQRQVAYTESQVGQAKLAVLAQQLRAQNSDTHLRTYNTFLTKENAVGIIEDYDLVVDASDNFPTKYLINDACVMLKKPFVFAAVHGFEGQLSVFNFEKGPTYRCLFPKMPTTNEIPSCDDHGVLGVIPGIMGTLQALEVVKILTKIGEVMSGSLLIFNGLRQTQTKIKFTAKPENLKRSALEESYGEQAFCSPVRTITYEELKKLGNSVQLVDVRNPDEYAHFHLENAKNIPLNQLSDRLKSLDLETPIYFICQSGKRSELACNQVQEQYAAVEVFSVAEGMNRYDLLNT